MFQAYLPTKSTTKYYAYEFAAPMAMRSGVAYGIFCSGVIKSSLTPTQAAVVAAGLFLAEKAFDKLGVYLKENEYVPNRLTFDQIKWTPWLFGKNIFDQFNGTKKKPGEFFQFISDAKDYNEKDGNWSFHAKIMSTGKAITGTTHFDNPKHWLNGSEDGAAVAIGTVALMVFKAFTLKEAFVQSVILFAASKIGQQLIQQDIFSSIYLHGAIHKAKTLLRFAPHGVTASVDGKQ